MGRLATKLAAVTKLVAPVTAQRGLDIPADRKDAVARGARTPPNAGRERSGRKGQEMTGRLLTSSQTLEGKTSNGRDPKGGQVLAEFLYGNITHNAGKDCPTALIEGRVERN